MFAEDFFSVLEALDKNTRDILSAKGLPTEREIVLWPGYLTSKHNLIEFV